MSARTTIPAARATQHTRRQRVTHRGLHGALRALTLVAALHLVGATAAARVEPAAAVGVVGAIGMTVADLERSVDFYGRVLGFTRTAEVEVAGEPFERLEGVFGLRMRAATMALGDESIVLTEYLTPRGRPVPVDARANDRSFQHVAIIVRDMARAYAWLRQNRVAHASTGPQRLPASNPDAAGIEAFYFRDPDGHFLELLALPPGKGDARWHRPGDDLFLGIDHTAIVVADTDASLALYRDTLGMRVAGTSENHGTEQEHLNNVQGAHLRITTLRAPAGPGIELLEYLAPDGGRPSPDDLRANDLAHWQTRLVVADPARAEHVLRALPVTFVSPGLVQLPDDALGFASGFLVRDLDGHALEVVAASDDRAPERIQGGAP